MNKLKFALRLAAAVVEALRDGELTLEEVREILDLFKKTN